MTTYHLPPDDEILPDLIAGRYCDGSSVVTIPDGAVVTLSAEPDPYMSIVDESGHGVWCGSLAYAERDRETGHYVRPAGYTGAAEILHVGRSYDAVWWEPPADVRAPGPVRDALRSTVSNLLESGYYVLSVTYAGPDRDYYGRPIIRAAASIGGIEPDPDDDYLSDLLSDLLSDIRNILNNYDQNGAS